MVFHQFVQRKFYIIDCAKDMFPLIPFITMEYNQSEPYFPTSVQDSSKSNHKVSFKSNHKVSFFPEQKLSHKVFCLTCDNFLMQVIHTSHIFSKLLTQSIFIPIKGKVIQIPRIHCFNDCSRELSICCVLQRMYGYLGPCTLKVTGCNVFVGGMPTIQQFIQECHKR